MSQSEHFIQNATQRPDVRFLIVWFLLTDFRRQVVRSSDSSLCTIICVLQDSGYTKVSNLYLATLSHENILRLQISVKNFSIVYVFDSECHLDKPVKNLVLRVTD